MHLQVSRGEVVQRSYERGVVGAGTSFEDANGPSQEDRTFLRMVALGAEISEIVENLRDVSLMSLRVLP